MFVSEVENGLNADEAMLGDGAGRYDKPVSLNGAAFGLSEDCWLLSLVLLS